MARFASEAELKAFLGKLDADYSQFASALWHNGVKTAHQLANARESILLSCGLPELYIDDIKARADTTGELLACNTLYKRTCWLECYNMQNLQLRICWLCCDC